MKKDAGKEAAKKTSMKIGAKLTEAGRELLAEGRELLRIAADLECRVQQVARGWEAELRIAETQAKQPAIARKPKPTSTCIVFCLNMMILAS